MPIRPTGDGEVGIRQTDHHEGVSGPNVEIILFHDPIFAIRMRREIDFHVTVGDVFLMSSRQFKSMCFKNLFALSYNLHSAHKDNDASSC